MARKIITGLAIAAGAGLLIGLGSRTRPSGEISAEGDSADDDLPSLEPMLERLIRIESRISDVEARPIASAGDGSVSGLDLGIQRQADDIETLRAEINSHRQTIAEDIATVDRRFSEVAKGIPAVLESIIVPRIEDLRVHLRSEIQQSVNATLTKFERAIDDKVSDRIDALEKALLDQSTVVTGLGQRAVESDMNMQRLVSAVERLCERNPAFRPAGSKEPSFLEVPFPTQTNEAAKRRAAEPGPAPGFESAFRPRIIKDEEEAERHHRIPLTQL